MNLALVGDGKMSRALAQLALERGHVVSTVVTQGENPDGTALTRDRLRGAEVVLEFTGPKAAPANLVALARLGMPVITGTTGWQGRLGEVAAAFEAGGGALLHSPNFSIGVQLFLRGARDLARRFAGHPGFAGFVVETHHAGKRDAPSGTAIVLQDALRAGDPAGEFGITSIRGGHVPGTHEVVFDAPYETVRLQHVARGRQVFAAGALVAAEWIRGKRGVFTFDQMLFGEGP